MQLSKLETGQCLLVLRYSLSYKKNIIDLHKELIEKQGFVWYGKLGNETSQKIIAEIFAAKNPALLLFKKDKAFLCGVEEITGNKPQSGYPKYYDDEYICPGCYYKLTSIDEVEVDIINELIVRSSKRLLSDTLSRQCTSSCFFVSYKELLPLKAKSIKKPEKRKLSKNDCIFKRSGKCTNRSFINFGYECERPSECSKQKR